MVKVLRAVVLRSSEKPVSDPTQDQSGHLVVQTYVFKSRANVVDAVPVVLHSTVSGKPESSYIFV